MFLRSGFCRNRPEPEVGRRHLLVLTQEGRLYLAVFIDLIARHAVGTCLTITDTLAAAAAAA